MKHVLLAFAFVAVLLSAAVTFGQTPPPTPPPAYNPYIYNYAPTPRPVCGWWEFWCGDSVYRNPNLSPVTKKMLYDHDPRICHCDECRRARLAAGVEYMGFRPYRVPTPGLIPPVYTPTPVVPRTNTPAVPPLQPWRSRMLIYCRSTNSVITRAECPDKK